MYVYVCAYYLIYSAYGKDKNIVRLLLIDIRNILTWSYINAHQ